MMRACLTALALCVCVGVAQAETGIASVYGYGRVTASGARFDPRALTAAHCTLPFGTLVKVCRIGGNCIVVRINDRGPFVRGCIIDLTPAAAHAHHRSRPCRQWHIVASAASLPGSFRDLVSRKDPRNIALIPFRSGHGAPSIAHQMPVLLGFFAQIIGDPGRIRTCDLQLRRLLLYPLSYGAIRRQFYIEVQPPTRSKSRGHASPAPGRGGQGHAPVAVPSPNVRPRRVGFRPRPRHDC